MQGLGVKVRISGLEASSVVPIGPSTDCAYDSRMVIEEPLYPQTPLTLK